MRTSVSLHRRARKNERASRFFLTFLTIFFPSPSCLLVAHSVHCVAYIVYRNFQFPALFRARRRFCLLPAPWSPNLEIAPSQAYFFAGGWFCGRFPRGFRSLVLR